MNTCSEKPRVEGLQALKDKAHQFRRDYVDFWIEHMRPCFLRTDDDVFMAMNKLITTITDFQKAFTPPQDDIISELKGVGDDLFDMKRFGSNAVVNKAIKLIEIIREGMVHPFAKYTENPPTPPHPNRPEKRALGLTPSMRDPLYPKYWEDASWNECCDAWEEYLRKLPKFIDDRFLELSSWSEEIGFIVDLTAKDELIRNIREELGE